MDRSRLIGDPETSQLGQAYDPDASEARYMVPAKSPRFSRGPLKRSVLGEWILTIFVSLLQIGLFFAFIVEFSRTYWDDGPFLEEDDLRLEILLALVVIGGLCALVNLVRSRRLLGRALVPKRDKETRQYVVLFLFACASLLSKMVGKNESVVLDTLFLVETLLTTLLAVFESSKYKMAENGLYSSVAGEPPFKITSLVSMAVFLTWHLMQFAAFVGKMQSGSLSGSAINISASILMFISVRFRSMSYWNMVVGFNVASPFEGETVSESVIQWETVYYLLALLFQTFTGFMLYFYTYKDAFNFEATFQGEYLELDTASILAICVISIYFAGLGLRTLLHVSQTSNYRGPSVIYSAFTVFLRYEYSSYHALAVYNIFYLLYRMLCSKDGYIDGEYELVGVHMAISNICVIVEVVMSVLYATALSFMPPVSQTCTREYTQLQRSAVVVLWAQLILGIKALVEFVAYLSEPDIDNKIGILLGFGVIPVMMYRFDTATKFLYKLNNARRINIFTHNYHNEELFVGTRLSRVASPDLFSGPQINA